MGAYAYKEVTHRPDFEAAIPEYEKAMLRPGEKYEGGVDYDGESWLVAGFLLDKKDAEIARLKALLAPAQPAACPDCRGVCNPGVSTTPVADEGEAHARCSACAHPPHLGVCTGRNGQTAYACGCLQAMVPGSGR